MKNRREKTFATGRPQHLDRNQKARLFAYAKAWSVRNRRRGQHCGPITWAHLAVLGALLRFSGSSGLVFPSYEAIARASGVARSTVGAALVSLEESGLLTWVHRIIRVKEVITDLFGRRVPVVRVHRSSNSYSFCLPWQRAERPPAHSSDKRSGTQNQFLTGSVRAPASTPNKSLERALASLGAVVSKGSAVEEAAGQPEAT